MPTRVPHTLIYCTFAYKRIYIGLLLHLTSIFLGHFFGFSPARGFLQMGCSVFKLFVQLCNLSNSSFATGELEDYVDGHRANRQVAQIDFCEGISVCSPPELPGVCLDCSAMVFALLASDMTKHNVPFVHYAQHCICNSAYIGCESTVGKQRDHAVFESMRSQLEDQATYTAKKKQY